MQRFIDHNISALNVLQQDVSFQIIWVGGEAHCSYMSHPVAKHTLHIKGEYLYPRK